MHYILPIFRFEWVVLAVRRLLSTLLEINGEIKIIKNFQSS